MSKYRQIQTKFWQDSFIEDLSYDQKYFYIYLLTNPACSQCGIYEITAKTISYQSGFPMNMVQELLAFFEEKGKIKYSMDTSEICIINFRKHNWTSSPKVIACIQKELKMVKDRSLLDYIYGMDTISQEKEKEKEKEEKKEKQNRTKDILGVNSFKNIQDSKYFELAKKINDFFGFELEPDIDKYKTCIEFLERLDTQNKLSLFHERLDFYIKYKELSNEKIHGFKAFLGEKSAGFENGGWNANNWKQKYEVLQKRSENKNQNFAGQKITNDLKYKKWK